MANISSIGAPKARERMQSSEGPVNQAIKARESKTHEPAVKVHLNKTAENSESSDQEGQKLNNEKRMNELVDFYANKLARAAKRLEGSAGSSEAGSGKQGLS